MHVFVFYFLLMAFSILVYMLFSYSAFRLQECLIKSVSQSRVGNCFSFVVHVNDSKESVDELAHPSTPSVHDLHPCPNATPGICRTMSVSTATRGMWWSPSNDQWWSLVVLPSHPCTGDHVTCHTTDWMDHSDLHQLTQSSHEHWSVNDPTPTVCCCPYQRQECFHVYPPLNP